MFIASNKAQDEVDLTMKKQQDPSPPSEAAAPPTTKGPRPPATIADSVPRSKAVVGTKRKADTKAETTRQKNNRKQKLGQATFTVKAERECPDIWQGR